MTNHFDEEIFMNPVFAVKQRFCWQANRYIFHRKKPKPRALSMGPASGVCGGPTSLVQEFYEYLGCIENGQPEAEFHTLNTF